MKENNLKQSLSKRFCAQTILRVIKPIMLLLFVLNLNLQWANAEEPQQRKVTGTVTDSKTGTALPGVNITVMGSVTGTISDSNGQFSIDVPNENSVLVFSFIGYVDRSIKVGNQALLSVSLDEEITSLQEVVVTGYGTSTRAKLTGSVATVSAAEITKRPLTNVQSLLQGKASGLQISSHSGKPGEESNILRIRGLGTFSAAGSDPLVLINGIAGDMTNLDPNDVESVSVLKDASSAAIYGARAANGVILITTKKGKNEPLSIDFSSSVSTQSATRLPELDYNSVRYMEFWNEARIRNGEVPYFTQADIDGYKNNPNDPVKYPNFNWIDHSFHSAVLNNQSLNISGGNEKTTFNLSLGYFAQPGVTSVYSFKKYNGRVSVETKVKDWIKVGGDIQVAFKDYIKSNWDNGDVDYQVLAIYGCSPQYTPTMTLPNGSTGYVARYSNQIGEWTVRNPDAQDASGIQTDQRYNMLPGFYATITPLKGLTWFTKFAATYDTRQLKNHEHAVDNFFFKDGTYAHNNSTWQLGVRETWSQNLLKTFFSTMDYKHTFNSVHNIGVLGGFQTESNLFRSVGGTKTTFPTPDLLELDAGASLNQTTSGRLEEWAIMSFFGRANYDYKSKYLLEVNFRYDGTSRIASDTRWGLFPSVAVGWRVSEEEFMKSIEWIDNLKIRGSWGQLGNQNVGLYPYQPVMSTTSYPFTTAYPGAWQTRMTDPTLKWETTTVSDLGFDLSVAKGLFSLIFDVYNKYTDDILYGIPIPASIGLSAPTVNYGAMSNKGFDFEVGSTKRFGDFSYNATFNLSHYKNNVERILTPSYGNYIIKEGLPFNSHYMVEWIGIFQNQTEITTGPTHQFNPKPGDLKFKDQLTVDTNADGVPDQADGKIDANDRVVVPGAYPKFFYGGNINLSWKNFDLSTFLQGVEGLKMSTQGLSWGLVPYIQGSPAPVDFVKNRWTGEGSTNSQPAMYKSGYSPVTGTRNTYWLLDASYFRLKSLSIGYNVPIEVCKKIGLQFLRVYVAGDNIGTITKWPGSDPEKANTGWFESYPQVTTYTLGIKIKI